MSLLLITIFRALTIYTVGASFTQHMWQIYRKEAFKVRVIEDVFQIRSNIWGLANHYLIRKAPLLFVMASFSWLIPLALVYPSGGLVI